MKSETEKLTGSELQRQFIENRGLQVYGPENGPYLLIDYREREVLVFGADNYDVVKADLEGSHHAMLLADLESVAASFEINNDGVVLCTINGNTEKGVSYAEAGMRARITASKMK